MRETYGLSDATRRLKFETIKQADNENEKEFLARVINSYYNSKGLQKPADAQIDETAKADISHRYRLGLRNERVRELMTLNAHGIAWGNLGTTALNYAQSIETLKTSQASTVNKIEEEPIHVVNKIAEAENRALSRNFSRLESQLAELVLKIDEPKEMRCWRCNHVGHRIAECRASPKTVAKARKQKSRSREKEFRGRSREREYSRSPSPYRRRLFSRERTPYPRERSASRERNRRSPPPRIRGRSPRDDGRYRYRRNSGRSQSGDRYITERRSNSPYRRERSNSNGYRRVRFN